ncbi:MAG: peptidylprolyl isomerase [Paracoccaceae bacterium]
MLLQAQRALIIAAFIAATGPAQAQDAATEAPANPEAAATEAPAAPARDVTADTVVATVNGTAITLGHMIVMRGHLPEQYQTLPPDVLFNGILDQLVQQVLLSQTAENDLTKRDTLALENERRTYLANKVMDIAVTEAVTEEALQKAYDAKFASVEPGKEFNASHILVPTEDEAKAIKADLDAGGDFEAIAKEKSQDGSAAGGGSLGWFGLGMMVKPFEDAVLSLEKGKISDPVQTDFGWHIVKLNDTRVATAPTLDDVREELTAEVQNAAAEAKIKELTDAGKVELSINGIAPEVLQDGALLDN